MDDSKTCGIQQEMTAALPGTGTFGQHDKTRHPRSGIPALGRQPVYRLYGAFVFIFCCGDDSALLRAGSVWLATLLWQRVPAVFGIRGDGARGRGVCLADPGRGICHLISELFFQSSISIRSSTSAACMAAPMGRQRSSGTKSRLWSVGAGCAEAQPRCQNAPGTFSTK